MSLYILKWLLFIPSMRNDQRDEEKEGAAASDSSSEGLPPRSVIQLRVKPTDKALWEHYCEEGKLSDWLRSLGRANLAMAVRATRGCYVRLTGWSAVHYWCIYAVADDMAIYDRRGDRVEDPFEGDHEIDDLHTYADIHGGIGDEVWGIVEVESILQQGEEGEDYVTYYELEMVMWAANSADEAAYTYGLATGTKQYRVYSLRTMAGSELDAKIPDVEVGID